MTSTNMTMERRPYTTNYPDVYDAESVIRKFLLSRANQLRLTYGERFKETVQEIEDDLLETEKTPDGTHAFYELSSRLKRRLNTQTLLWPMATKKQEHYFSGLINPTFYRLSNGDRELLGKVDTAREQITLYLTYRELHALMDSHLYAFEWHS